MKTMTMTLVLLLAMAVPAIADRGPILVREDVKLTQESQKAIILHNGTEEVLILGTELNAADDMEILEFIPFPAEPKVSLAKGDPFVAVSKLIADRKIVFYRGGDGVSKGRNGDGVSTTPVEITFSQKIGNHDVTSIKINDIEGFTQWVRSFFTGKGISVTDEKLAGVSDNARDYMKRGYVHFVFDYVRVSRQTRFLEPLVYRFNSGGIYYPLKTSNLIGGKGMVELVLLAPGSINEDIWQDALQAFPRGLDLSSSAKVYRADVAGIYPDKGFFSPRSKIYMQMVRYKGPYAFASDFIYDVKKLAPYAYRFGTSGWHGQTREFDPPYTKDEQRDIKEALCPFSSDLGYHIRIIDNGVDCINFIPREEYDVYAAIFRADSKFGLPRAPVELQKMTGAKQIRKRSSVRDEALKRDFNDKNRIEYPLENAFPDDGMVSLVRDDKVGMLTAQGGRIFVSRVGFNKDRSKALVRLDRIVSPRSGGEYYVTLEKKNGEWVVVNAVMEAIY